MSAVTWLDVEGELTPHVEGERVAWAAQPGSQEAFISCPIFECLYEGNRGGGKRIANSEKIPTDSGWKLVGDVTLGDRLLAPDGTCVRILQIDKVSVGTMYRITFCDGATVLADADHRWLVRAGKNAKRDGWLVRTTQELLDLRDSYYIPTMSAAAPGPIFAGPDPYVLGLILGDGTVTSKYVTVYGHTKDEEIKDHLRSQGFTVKQYRPNCFQAYHTSAQDGEKWRNVLGRCVGDAKHSPAQLLNADPFTRLAFLQGLMDADGSVDKDGRCSFASVSRQLAEDVQYLTRSLGGKASLVWKKHRRMPRGGYFHVCVMPCNKFVPFRLTRKILRCKPMKGVHRRIVSIEKVQDEPATCFAVDHPSHLFVVTPAFVVTHNTLLLALDFAQHCDQGLGPTWRGILFRQTYPQLADVISKTKEWFPRIFGIDKVRYNEQRATWTWSGGEELLLRHMADPDDYWNYHGHSYPWIAFEELVTWPSADCYLKMMSVCRSSNPKAPRKYRSTANPYGPGHNWVKQRFQLPLRRGVIVGPVLKAEDPTNPSVRVAVHSDLRENKVLLHADPGYIPRLRSSASNEAQLRAWLEGDWDIVAGGMIDDVWGDHARLPPFNPPATWRLDRSFDWGSSHPFSVGWYAESDGSPLTIAGRRINTVKGDVFRIAEWYGCTKKPNEGLRLTAEEIARGIRERERSRFPDRKVYPGPADSSIFDSSTSTGTSVADAMAAHGVRWLRADKGPGSRINGWARMRSLLSNAKPPTDGTPREHAGFFVTDECKAFLRTVPTLPRDDRNPDDVDTEAEDHVGDEVRYRLYDHRPRFSRQKVVGR